MERKIGEIFEFKKDWYQCVEGRCKDCHFSEKRFLCKQFITKDFCTHGIIFKKLEKVGEPYMDGGKMMQKYKRVYREPIYFPYKELNCYNDLHGRICIEIKQNKKDMEEKKHCDGCKYSDEEMKIIEKAEKDVRKAMGGAFGLPKDIPYLHSFVSSALELGWLDKYKEHSNSEKIEKDLKEFSLEAAKAGKTVCTRDGRKARIICFDKADERPIVALISDSGSEFVYEYLIDGRCYKSRDDDNDLMMLPEKKEGWVNVYRNIIYKTKEEAFNRRDKENYLMTIKVGWEE